MADESVVAAPTPATVEAPAASEAQPSFDLPRSGTPEYDKWRETGEISDKSPKEESTPSKESETAGESETPQSTQEKPTTKPKQTAEERIAQLEATIEKIRKGAGKETPKVESSPTKPEPPAPQADNEPTAEDVNADGSPRFKTYEEFTKALARYEARQERAEWQREQQMQEQAKAFNAKVDEARSRYDNFDEVVQPAATAINMNVRITEDFKKMLSRSEFLPDILFTIGSDEKTLANFVKMSEEDPLEAAVYVAEVRKLIEEELGKASATSAANRNEQGQFTPAKPVAEKPAKRGPESAPAPPLEVGARGAGTMDEGERALQAIERGDGRAVSAWMEAENRKDIARRAGR